MLILTFLKKHCLKKIKTNFFSVDYGAHPQHWLLFDRILQQIILQSENQEDHDLTVMNLNVQDLVQQ